MASIGKLPGVNYYIVHIKYLKRKRLLRLSLRRNETKAIYTIEKIY